MLVLNLLLYIFVGFVLYLAWKIHYPLFVAILYKLRYGEMVIIKFFPFLGALGLHMMSERKHGDNQYWLREIKQKNPKCKALMTNLLFSPQIYVIETEMAREALITHPDKYKFSDLLYCTYLYFDNGLIFSHGKLWKRQRELISHAFAFQELKSRVPTTKLLTKAKCAQLDQKADGKQTIQIIKECQQITGEVIIRTFFGKDFSNKQVDGMNAIDIISTFMFDCIEVTASPWYFLKSVILGKRLATQILQSQKEKQTLRKIYALRKLALETIDDSLKNFDQNSEPKLLIDYYLKELNNSQSEVTKDEIIHQFVSFYFAGMETTANLSGKAIYFLGMYPDVYQKVEQEIDKYFKDPNDIQHEDLEKLTYVNAYIQEILRYSAPAPILGQRDLIEPFTLGGIKLQSDILLDINFHVIVRDPKNFDDPDTFKPERWLDPQTSRQGFLPFGAGKRNCIGQHLAQIEARIILIYFVKNFKILFNSGKKIVMGSTTLYSPIDDGLIRLIKKVN